MSLHKENTEGNKKKSKSRLSIKIFGSNSKKRETSNKINEGLKGQQGSYKTQSNDATDQEPAKEVKELGDDIAKEVKKTEVAAKGVMKTEDAAKGAEDGGKEVKKAEVAAKVVKKAEVVAKEVKMAEVAAKEVNKAEVAAKEVKMAVDGGKGAEDVGKADTDSHNSKANTAVLRLPAFRPGRRRSLSACADVLDTLVKIKSKEEDDLEEEEDEEEDQLSPLPCSPTRSCLRGRSATISYPGEEVESESRPRAVTFSPETVDPPPRTVKYRAWVEARSKPPPVNVKHEKHKQQMNQLKKVNMSDYLASRKNQSGGGMSSAFGGGGGGMMM